MSSNFPNQIDEIPQFLDITSNDGVLLKEFKNYINKNDFVNANKTLNKIENASQKIISANKMNQFRDCIIALENFYKTDITKYTNQKQDEWQSIINRFQFKGDYSSTIAYDINNIVLYQEKGQNNLYIKINEEKKSGVSPNDDRYWRKLTVEGEKGDTVAGSTTFMFEWKSSQNYPTDSIVSHNNKWWISIRQNQNSEPIQGSSNWKIIMESMQALYPVQQSAPLNQSKGELWFEVI